MSGTDLRIVIYTRTARDIRGEGIICMQLYFLLWEAIFPMSARPFRSSVYTR